MRWPAACRCRTRPPRPPRPPGSRSSSPAAPCCWRCPACSSPAYRTSGPWATPRGSSCCSSWPPRSPCCRHARPGRDAGLQPQGPAHRAPRGGRVALADRRPAGARGGGPAGRVDARLDGAAARARGARTGHEAGQRRRGQRGRVDHDPPGLRPGGRRLRPGCQRAAAGRAGRRQGRWQPGIDALTGELAPTRGVAAVSPVQFPRRHGRGGHRDARPTGRRTTRPWPCSTGSGPSCRREPSSAASPRG